MRNVGRWLREDPKRFVMIVVNLSVFGIVSIVVEAIWGLVNWGTGSSATAFMILLLLAFAYARGDSR